VNYRTLGKTGLDVSEVAVGCWQMGGVDGVNGWTGTNDKESVATIHRAQEIGINLLDTAEGYGKGHSEEVLGMALPGRRDKFIVATKVWLTSDDADPSNSRNRILEACEGSLERLKSDYIDIYQLHSIPHDNAMPLVMETLAELKEQGKIRWFGISTNDVGAIRKLLALGDLATIQVGYNLLSRSGEEALELAREENLGTLIRGPLASGALSGRYNNTVPDLDEQDRRRRWWLSENSVAKFSKLPQLDFLLADGKRTMVQAALRFILDTPGVTAVIPGTKSRKQLEGNAGAAGVPSLTPEERSKAIQVADLIGGM